MAFAGMSPRLVSAQLIMERAICLRLLALRARSAGTVFGQSEGGSGSGSSAARPGDRARVARADANTNPARYGGRSGNDRCDRRVVMVVSNVVGRRRHRCPL